LKKVYYSVKDVVYHRHWLEQTEWCWFISIDRSERVLRISGKRVPEDLAREVFFNDSRINVLGLLIQVNVAVVLLNSTLQIVIAVLDVRYLIEVLVLVPLIFNVFNFLTAVLFCMAKIQKSARLLVTSLVFPLTCAGLGVAAMVLFGATTVLSCSPCVNSSCEYQFHFTVLYFHRFSNLFKQPTRNNNSRLQQW